MSADSSLLIRSIVGVLAGLLIASGYLPSETKDAFINDASAVGGLVLILISGAYALEHALLKVKSDLKVPVESAAVTKTVTTTTVPSTPIIETPAPPAT